MRLVKNVSREKFFVSGLPWKLMHSTRAWINSNLSSFEDLVTKFEFQGTVNLHLHGTVCVIIKFLYPNSLAIAYFFVPLWKNRH